MMRKLLCFISYILISVFALAQSNETLFDKAFEYDSLAVIEYNNTNFEKAIKLSNKAIECIGKTTYKDSSDFGVILLHQSLNYLAIGNTDNFLKLSFRSKDLFASDSDPASKEWYFYNMSILEQYYRYESNFEDAIPLKRLLNNCMGYTQMSTLIQLFILLLVMCVPIREVKRLRP